jgi:hypothetical protein
MNRKEETKAVKGALAAVGIKASVCHGTGSAYAWLDVCIRNTYGEHNHSFGGNRLPFNPDTCPVCSQIRDAKRLAVKIVQKVTGRQGEYDGKITIQHWL